MKKNSLIFSALAGSFILFSSCKKDKVEDPKKNEENEVITTVKIHLTPPGGGMAMATWKDLTPADAAGQSVDTLRIDSGIVYTGRVELLDETKNPFVDRSLEVKKEDYEHLFVFKQEPVTPAFFEVKITDKDKNNLPVGLAFTFEGKKRGVATLNVILKHQPGVKNGSEAPGDSDVDIKFPVKIK